MKIFEKKIQLENSRRGKQYKSKTFKAALFKNLLNSSKSKANVLRKVQAGSLSYFEKIAFK